MNSRAFLLLPAVVLLALPARALADARPDFDDDAKPILRAQPHLLEYIKTNFKVEEKGFARVPGTEDHAPPPPYIFRAKHRGESGPDHITLLIQPGAPGHILLVKEDAPGAIVAPAPNPGYAPMPGAQPEAPAPTESAPPPSDSQPISSSPPPQESAPAPAAPASSGSSAPTSSTPSGPIMDSNSSSPNGGSLAPPPDPAPAN